MEERCELCKFYRRLKHNFERGKGFEESHCCVIFEQENEVLEVAPTSMCEMFTRK